MITHMVGFCSMSAQRMFSLLLIFATTFKLFQLFPCAFILAPLSFACFADLPLLISSPTSCWLILSCSTVPTSLLLPVSPFL